MYRCFLLAVFILVGIQNALAQTMTAEQRSEFLELLPPPSINLQYGFSFDRHGFSIKSEELEELKSLDSLLSAKVPESPNSHAEYLLELAKRYRENNQEEKAIASAAKAASLWKSLLEDSSVSNRNELLGKLGHALLSQNKDTEAEMYFRQAAKESPQSWESLTDLARFLENKAVNYIYSCFAVEQDNLKLLGERFSKRRLSPKEIKYIKEIKLESDYLRSQSQKFITNKSSFYKEYLSSTFKLSLINSALKESQSSSEDLKPLILQGLHNQEFLKTLEKIITIQKDDPLPIATWAFYYALDKIIAHKNELNYFYSPVEEKGKLLDAVKRLKAIGGDTKRDNITRGRAWEGAALVTMFANLGDASECIQSAWEVAPERTFSRTFRVLNLLKDEKFDEGYALAEEYFKATNTAFARLFLARVALPTGRLPEAITQYRLLKDHSEYGVVAHLGLITALMKRSDKEPALLQEAINEHRALCDRVNRNFGDELVSSLFVAAGIQALEGDIKSAIASLELARTQDPNSEEKIAPLLKILKEVR
jgi:hypothetical protein